MHRFTVSVGCWRTKTVSTVLLIINYICKRCFKQTNKYITRTLSISYFRDRFIQVQHPTLSCRQTKTEREKKFILSFNANDIQARRSPPLFHKHPRTIDLRVLKRIHRRALANYKVKLNIDMQRVQLAPRNSLALGGILRGSLGCCAIALIVERGL